MRYMFEQSSIKSALVKNKPLFSVEFFPPKNEEVIYTPQVMVIRDELLNVAINNIFTVSFISIFRL